VTPDTPIKRRAGAAQASAATATGFGYFGAAMNIYNAFLAKGSNVELPVDARNLSASR
jgi:hypothetical protein